jgi:pimeloyl-ACP methyl ester carboxylesterase
MSKPKLLLLHGALGQSSEFAAFIQLLTPHFECFTINFSGHGDTQEESQAFNLEILTQDLKQFLNVHGRDHYIFGYSLGGFVALKYCIENEDRLPLGIITYATKFDWTEEIRNKFIARLNPTDVQTKGGLFLDTLLSRYGGKWHFLLRQTAQLIDNMPRHRIEAIDLEDITIPIRIGVGDQDRLVTIQESQGMTQYLSGDSFYLCSNSGHELEKSNLIQLTEEVVKIHQTTLRQ